MLIYVKWTDRREIRLGPSCPYDIWVRKPWWRTLVFNIHSCLYIAEQMEWGRWSMPARTAQLPVLRDTTECPAQSSHCGCWLGVSSPDSNPDNWNIKAAIQQRKNRDSNYLCKSVLQSCCWEWNSCPKREWHRRDGRGTGQRVECKN